LAAGIGDVSGLLARFPGALSVVARAEEGPKGALDHLERAMKLARELEYPQLLARIGKMLAYVNVTLRRWEAAEAYGEESSRQYASIGNLVLAADSQRVVGHCQMQAGRPLDSLATLQESLRFSQQIVNLWGEADCSWKLALTQLELGEYGEAIRSILERI
jgi:tetratricopeptide (TPR) repeat protein